MKYFHLVSTFCLLFFSFCKMEHHPEEVETAMTLYHRLWLEHEIDSLTGMFMTDGDLGDQAHGRKEIKEFLSMADFGKLLSNRFETKTLVFQGDHAIHTGTFEQVITSGHDTLLVTGVFNGFWQWTVTQSWLIKRMEHKMD